VAEYRIPASRVGSGVQPLQHDKRICTRCGRECNVNGNPINKTRRHMCTDCRSVDRAMALRLGYK
jgi:predicted  nucleic acid-binding Zn ribbon protein